MFHMLQVLTLKDLVGALLCQMLTVQFLYQGQSQDVAEKGSEWLAGAPGRLNVMVNVPAGQKLFSILATGTVVHVHAGYLSPGLG